MSSPTELAAPLRDPTDLDPLLERVGDARIVCIGEASHGTEEFYAWRAALTRRLICEAGFDLVTVEGDWPACYQVHRSVTGAPGAPQDPREALGGFTRWPTWMWANEVVSEFTRWLAGHNRDRPATDRVGFYGFDVYSLWDSLRAVLAHLHEHRPDDVPTALRAYRCFEPYAEDPAAYARATRLVPTDCEEEIVSLLTELVEQRGRGGSGDPFDAEQNARAAVGAEAYYRAMIRGGPESWNVRDTHMVDTVDRLLEHHDRRAGDGRAKAVVWAHNTHVGDARYTDMADAGMVNVGQLLRERHGEEDCVLVGFGSHHGTVLAGREWGLPRERMRVPEARADSVEALLHETVDDRALFVFGDPLPDWAARPREHRAIGVVYRPAAERWGNYVSTVLGRRYDAFCWLDETSALTSLDVGPPRGGEEETWPFAS